MQLTPHADYALRTLIYLAVHSGERVTIQAIADAYSISKNHLMKIVQQLAREGLVDATRGRSGGLRLAGDPTQIRLGDVVRRVESNFDIVECFNRNTNQCVITPACRLKEVFAEAKEAFIAVLDHYTLDDIVQERRRTLIQLLAIGGSVGDGD